MADEDGEFPFAREPVLRECRMLYATAYLERKRELQGLDPAGVKTEEKQALLLEMELMDIVCIFHILTCACFTFP